MNEKQHSVFRSVRRWFYLWLGVFFGIPLMTFIVVLLCGVFDYEIPGYCRLLDWIAEPYFYLPALVFGGAHFGPRKVCYLPEDAVGFCLTIGLYLFLALSLSVILGIVTRRRRINGISEPAPRPVP